MDLFLENTRKIEISQALFIIPDAELEAFDSLKCLREKSLAALQYASGISGDPCRIYVIMLSLPVLRHIDIMAKQYWFKVKKEQKIPLNDLFEDMLNAC